MPLDPPPKESGIYLFDTTAGQLYLLSGLEGGLTEWSPDGTAVLQANCCAPNGTIDIVEMSSGQAVRVPAGDPWLAVWSPDSRRIAYVSADANGNSVGAFVVNRDGSGVRRVSREADLTALRWLNSGSIVYSAGTPPNERHYIVNLQASDPPMELPRNARPAALDPRVVFGSASANGEWVAYGESNVSVVWNRQTSEAREVAPAPARMAWSPKGSRLFLQYPEGQQTRTDEVVDLDAGIHYVLSEVGLGGAWAADGLHMYFLGFHCEPEGGSSGPQELFRRLFDGSEVSDVSMAPGELEYEFAPSPADGRVAYVSRVRTASPPSWKLRIRDIDLATTTELSFGEDPHIHGDAWSADGRYLRFWLGGSHGICD